ncbi:MAG: hypothetical protein L6U61_06070 [Bacteroidales bacterium]|nr:MAG: hypothetical protein L6U61_06070 [Bacteroidales bacterium]
MAYLRHARWEGCAESRHASASLRVPGYGKVPSLRDDADVAMAFLQPFFGGSCVCRRCHGVGKPTPC